MPQIISIEPKSPASRTKIAVGEDLISVNGHKIVDVLDYKFRTYDSLLRIVTRRSDGKLRLTAVRKSAGAELGLAFATSLIDEPKSCANNCVFCFVDQLPRGMRDTLYYKDDDTRLSFLQGNYVTLTNLSEREIQRIIDLKISPINVSVHSMNPELRAELLGNPQGGEGVAVIRRLADAGVTMNCQIVVCPGLNDGAELDDSIAQLAALYPEVASVSVVPVGLTRHRDGLPRLTPFTPESAATTIAQVEACAEIFLQSHGSRIFFCADELYIKAALPLPDDDAYEGYPQLENGVGMIRLLMCEFEDELASAKLPKKPQNFTVATGISAAPFIENLLCKLREKCDNISGDVIAVANKFFGETVDVAGLITGGDILTTLAERELGARLLLPRNMLRVGDDRDGGVFLDDVTVGDIERKLGVPVRVVEQDGTDLLRAMLGK